MKFRKLENQEEKYRKSRISPASRSDLGTTVLIIVLLTQVGFLDVDAIL